MKNRVHVRICNRVYSMITDESDMYTAQLSNELSDRIETVSKQSSLSLVDAAILTALELLDNIKKNNYNTDSIRSQVNEYIKIANEAKNQVEQLNVIIDQNDAVIQKLQQENNQLSEQLSIAQSTLANQQEDIKNITEYATAKEQENVQLTEQIKQLQEYIQQIQNAENQPIVSETENNKVENTKTQTTSKTKNSRKK